MRPTLMRVPDRKSLRLHPPVLLYRGRNWTKADILVRQDGVHRLAIKDYQGRPVWIRSTLGRYLIRREVTAYSCLAGLAGIPPFIGRVDACALAVGFVEGRSLSRFDHGDIPLKFFVQLRDLVDAIHRIGVAHGDLHQRDILITAEGSPTLVDFATAVLCPPGAGILRRGLFDAARRYDLRAVLKMKNRHHPGSLSDEELYQLHHPPSLYRWGKRVRSLFFTRTRGQM